jgi:PAS domain S-box-containing protein
VSGLAADPQVAGLGYSHVLNEIGLPLYVADGDGVFLWVNASAKAFVGDVVGRRISSVVVPEQITYAREQFARKVTGQAAVTDYDLTLLDSNGRRVPVVIHSVRLASNGTGAAVFGAAIPRNAERQWFDPADTEDQPAVHFTGRQHETLMLLGEGLGTAQIAAQLGISAPTARNHIQAVMEALGAHTRLEAVAEAHQTGLLPTTGADRRAFRNAT